MAKQPIRVRRLEQFLQSWEELNWAANIVAQGEEGQGRTPQFPLAGPVLHYGQLRKHLLEIREFDDFDFTRFGLGTPEVSGDNLMEQKNGFLDAGIGVSVLLAQWTTNSRRVYHLDPDLQALLSATSIESIATDDIKLPFRSFAVSLEHPIKAVNDKVEREFDFLLYGMTAARFMAYGQVLPMPTVILFNRNLEKWHPTSCRAQVERRLRQGNLNEAWALINHHNVIERNTTGLYRFTAYEMGRVGKVGDLLHATAEVVEQGSSAFNQAWRIVYGLCLYLSTLSKDSSKVSEWIPTEKTKRLGTLDSSAITDESQVCTVSSIRTLAPDERELLFRQVSGRAGGYEVRAHFRMGHWRRPPRTAHDSEQPKTIWVQPTLVRRDRLPEGAIPGGSEVVLSS